MAENEVDQHTGVETTGHEWDGIKELNNPLPRWWLYIFYATIVWSLVYWVFMPAWPGITGHTRGVRDHSERRNVAEAMADLAASRAEAAESLLAAANLTAIQSDPELMQFAMAAGESLFGDNCATCHGSGGQGFKGYPNLNDDAWLWGGGLDDIRTTLTVGIRAEHPDTRLGAMQAYGRDDLLPREEIAELAHYVRSLSGLEHDAEAAARAAPLFAEQCAMCHGAQGQGDPAQGAPNLADAVWLYGGEYETIYETIWNGRAGVMPAWEARLSEAEIAALAVYVHALGGGE